MIVAPSLNLTMNQTVKPRRTNQRHLAGRPEGGVAPQTGGAPSGRAPGPRREVAVRAHGETLRPGRPQTRHPSTVASSFFYPGGDARVGELGSVPTLTIHCSLASSLPSKLTSRGEKKTRADGVSGHGVGSPECRVPAAVASTGRLRKPCAARRMEPGNHGRAGCPPDHGLALPSQGS